MDEQIKSPAEIEADRIEAEAAAEEARAEAAAQARATAAATPEARALAARVRIDAAKARAAAEAQEALDEEAWLKARAQHGSRVARVYTAMGWIILRGMTTVEWDLTLKRAQDLEAAALEAGDAQKAAADSVKAFREELLSRALVHPEQKRAREICDAYPLVWNALFSVRDELNRGPRVAAGKGGAP